MKREEEIKPTLWCLPTSSSVYLFFFPVSQYRTRCFLRGQMIASHDRTTSVALLDRCQVFVWSDGLLDLVADLFVGNMVFVWDVQDLPKGPHFHGLYPTLRGSTFHMHTERWTEQGSASSLFWNWDDVLKNHYCCSVLHVIWALLASISGWEASSVIIDLRYLKLVTVSNLCPLTLTSVLIPWMLLVISVVFSVLISMRCTAEVLLRHSTKLASSCFSPATPPLSSANQRLVTVLPPILTVSSWFSKASVMILSRKMLKRVDESRHHCRTPTVVWTSAAIEDDCTGGLVVRCWMIRTRLEPMLYFLVVTHRAACHTLSKTSWSLWRHGIGLTDVKGVSHYGF